MQEVMIWVSQFPHFMACRKPESPDNLDQSGISVTAALRCHQECHERHGHSKRLARPNDGAGSSSNSIAIRALERSIDRVGDFAPSGTRRVQAQGILDWPHEERCRL